MTKALSYRPWMTKTKPDQKLDETKITLSERVGPFVSTDVLNADIEYFMRNVGHVIAYSPTIPSIQVYPFETPYVRLILLDKSTADITWKQWMDEELIFTGDNSRETTLTHDEFNEMNRIIMEQTMAIINGSYRRIEVSSNVFRYMQSIFGLVFRQKIVMRSGVVRKHDEPQFDKYSSLDVNTLCLLLELAAFSTDGDYVRFVDAFGSRRHDFHEGLVNHIYDVLDRESLYRNTQRDNAINVIRRGRIVVQIPAYKSPKYRINRPAAIANYVLAHFNRTDIFDFKTTNTQLIDIYMKYALSTYDESLFVFEKADYVDLLCRAGVLGPDHSIRNAATLYKTLVDHYSEWELMYVLNKIMSYLSYSK